MANIKYAKGAKTNAILRYIKKKWGANGLEQAMQYAAISKSPGNAEWIPVVKTYKLMEWIAENKGTNRLVEAAQYSVEDLGIFSHIVLSRVGIERALTGLEKHQNLIIRGGGIKTEVRNHEAIVLFEGANIGKYSPISWQASLEAIVKLTNADGEVELIRTGNPEDLKFRVKWR